MAYVISVLIKFGHTRADIYGSTLAQVGIFYREASRIHEDEQLHNRNNIAKATWIATHSSYKGFVEYLEDSGTSKLGKVSQKQADNDWDRLRGRLSQLGVG